MQTSQETNSLSLSSLRGHISFWEQPGLGSARAPYLPHYSAYLTVVPPTRLGPPSLGGPVCVSLSPLSLLATFGEAALHSPGEKVMIMAHVVLRDQLEKCKAGVGWPLAATSLAPLSSPPPQSPVWTELWWEVRTNYSSSASVSHSVV